MKDFLTSNAPLYRCLRTILQGIVGVLIANIDFIIGLKFDGTTKTMIVALVMAVLSPIMGELAKKD